MAGDTTIRFGKASIRLEGFTDFFRRLDRLGIDITEAAKEVFLEGANRVYRKSQALVPTDTMALKQSGRVSKPRVNKRGVVTASVNYGGRQLERITGKSPDFHAIVQHEDLTLKHPGGGQAKYLEQPMNREKAVIMRLLERRIAKELAKGKVT